MVCGNNCKVKGYMSKSYSKYQKQSSSGDFKWGIWIKCQTYMLEEIYQEHAWA